VQKNEQPFLPPVQKNEQPFLPPVKEQPQPPSMTPPVQQQFIPKNDPPKRSEPQITHLPPKKETPPAPPAVTFNEPQITQPPTKQVPATPVVEQRENRPTVLKDVKPLPPSNTYDRRYPPPVKLGAPREDNGTPAPSPLGNTTSTGGGQPVRIRMQPDLPPSREGIPVVTRPTSPSPTTDRPRLPVQVESTELRAYSPVQGDTYATISARFYGNDKYSAALAQFNVDKERDNRFSSVWPGQRIFIPAREYLERRYAAQIANTSQRPAARSPLDATGPTSRYLPPMETASAGAKEKLTTPVTAERTKSGNKSEYVRYMVREKDSLFSIAKKKLGNGDRWTEIYALNKELVPDPNKPETGVVLKLPADAKLDNAGSPE
jgi:LysM repeat protein